MKLHTLFFILLLSQTMLFCQDSERAKKAISTQSKTLKDALKNKGLQLGSPIFIRIFKESKELELWIQKENADQYILFKTYPICTYGGQGLGPKTKEGDKMAPEGFYYVPKSKLNPNSNYHLAFNLGYPNKYDLAHQRTGSALMVHGDCVSIGCYAMTDALIEEIYTLAYEALNKGQKYFKVHCFPFRMTEDNMKAHQSSKWYSFWKNLQEGYQYFEKNKRPPEVDVEDSKYIFK